MMNKDLKLYRELSGNYLGYTQIVLENVLNYLVSAQKTYFSVFQIYNHYSKRWAVETVHQVLKDVLGLDEGKMRLEPLVEAHILLVYLIHFLFLKYQHYLETKYGFILTPRQLYDHVRTSIPLIPDPLETQFQALFSEVTK